MKNILFTLTVFLAFTASSVQADTVYVGISPAHNAQTQKMQSKSLLKNLITSLEAGDRAYIFDAYDVKLIGTLKMPNEANHAQNPKAVLNANRKTVTELMQAVNADLHQGQIRLPQFLRFLGENYSLKKDDDILILGSPIYQDTQDEAKSMTDGKIPVDHALMLSPQKSLWGTVGQEQLLQGARLHFTFQDGWQENDMHAKYVKRFWTLFTQSLGAQNVTLTADPKTFWQRFKSKAAPYRHDYQIGIDTPHDVAAFEIPKNGTIFDRPLSSKTLTAQEIKAVQNLEVGISWSCTACDLDLYAQSDKNADPLFYDNIKSDEGMFHRDFTTSPQAENGYERISFHKAVDLHKLFLAVNFFSGHAPNGVTGEIRLSFNNKTYAAPFNLTAPKGNSGRGRKAVLNTKTTDGHHWTVIDVKDVLRPDV